MTDTNQHTESPEALPDLERPAIEAPAPEPDAPEGFTRGEWRGLPALICVRCGRASLTEERATNHVCPVRGE